MFYFAISVTKFFIMNSLHLEHPPKYEYPAIILDMTNFMEHLSDEYVCEKTEADNDGHNQIQMQLIVKLRILYVWDKYLSFPKTDLNEKKR